MSREPRHEAPTMARLLFLIVAMAFRRMVNRFSFLHARRAPGRTATSRRVPAGRTFFFLFSLALLGNGVLMSTQLVWRLAIGAERRSAGNVELVDEKTFALIERAQRRPQTAAQLERARSRLIDAFEQQAWLEEPIGARVEERTLELLRRYDEDGAKVFRPSPLASHVLLPRPGLWHGAMDDRQMRAPLALVALAVSLAVVMLSIGGLNQEVARVERTLEWWFSFPIPARGLFLARVLETAFANPLLWFFVFPLFTASFWCAGYGWAGIGLGFVAMAVVGSVAGSVRVVTETGMPRLLGQRWISALQVVFLVLGYPLLFFALAGVAPAVIGFIEVSAESVPNWLLANPVSLPIWWLDEPALWLPITVLFGGSTVAGAVLLSEHLVRDGLVRSYEPLQGGQRAAVQMPQRRWLTGLAYKELLLLARDRTLLVQSLIVPLAMVALQVFLNPQLISGARSSPRDAAAMAFGVGSVVLAMGATRVLAVEVPAIWLLATVPRHLDRLLADKTLIWSGIASVFAALLFVSIGGANLEFYLRGAPHLALALVGVFLYAFIGAGIGILGTDTLDPEPRRRVQVSMVYLFMLLSAMFGYALYTPSEWAKVVQLLLSGLLAFALWQRVRDQAPFLLDPGAAPPRRIAVSDGVTAALAFFVLQGLIALWLLRNQVSQGIALLVAFAGAGLIVSTMTLRALWRAGAPDLIRTLGLSVQPGRGSAVVGIGFAAGLVATAAGVGYLELLGLFVPLTDLKESVFDAQSGQREMLIAIATIGVFAAPIFEEFIFRGLLYGGFRRSLSPLRAAMASAAVFAMVHPPVAAVPVFVLALLNALAYERTRTLLAPIVGHMTYNTVLIGFELWPM